MPKGNKPPRFIDLLLEIDEDSMDGFVAFGSDYVKDSRSDTLTFSLNGDDASLFTIDSATGDISYIGSEPLDSNQSYSLIITVVDGGGNSVTETITIAVNDTVDTELPPAPTLFLDSKSDTGVSNSDGITTDTTPTLSGTAEARAVVTILDGAIEIGTATAKSNGTWKFTTSELTEGAHTFTAVATDAAGNTSSASSILVVDVDITAPTGLVHLLVTSDSGSSDTDGITKETAPVFRVSLTDAEAGDSVELLLDGRSFGTALTKVLNATDISNGYVEFAVVDGELGTDGVKSVSANLNDAAGNSSTTSVLAVTLDTQAPAAPTGLDLDDASDTGSSNTDDITDDTTPTINGTAEADSLVTLYDTDGTTILGTATAAGGTWSITSNVLADGAHTLTAKAVDVAGNESSASSGLVVTIDSGGDTQAPILQSFTSSTSDGTYGPGASINITATYDEAITAGSTLTVTLNNGETVVLDTLNGA